MLDAARDIEDIEHLARRAVRAPLRWWLQWTAAVLLIAAGPALAALDDELNQIRTRWSEIRYELPPSARTAAFTELAGKVEALTAAYPDHAAAWTWAGIVHGSLAESKGNLGALSLVKRARKELEQAIALDPEVMEGSALVTLGSIYYQVPGRPFGFGDDSKAREYLTRALAVAPDSIDTNFWYADFLRDQGEFDEAAIHARRALEAPLRPGSEVADAGRREAAQALLEAIEARRASSARN